MKGKKRKEKRRGVYKSISVRKGKVGGEEDEGKKNKNERRDKYNWQVDRV